MHTYPLAPNGVFHTIQGEGVLFGEPMVFVRLAACPIHCDGCDTDYSVAERLDVAEIGRRIASTCTPSTRWAWVTGGEPTIHELRPLYQILRKCNLRIALATAGVNPLGQLGYSAGGPDFVSVSPHRIDESWKVRSGDQVNIVPGLNGLRLESLDGVDFGGFSHRFVTPFWYTPQNRMEQVTMCVEWVGRHPGWRLGGQFHKIWGLP